MPSDSTDAAPGARFGVSRRSFLQAGGIASLALPARLLQAESAVSTLKKEVSNPGQHATIRSCILIYFYGGPSHLDTWDMKPAARLSGATLNCWTTMP